MRFHLNEHLNPFYMSGDIPLHRRWIDSSYYDKIKRVFTIIQGSTDLETPFQIKTLRVGLFDYLTLFIGIGIDAASWHLRTKNLSAKKPHRATPLIEFFQDLVNFMMRFVITSAITLTLMIPIAIFIHLPSLAAKKIERLLVKIHKDESHINPHTAGKTTYCIVNKKLPRISTRKLFDNYQKRTLVRQKLLDIQHPATGIWTYEPVLSKTGFRNRASQTPSFK